MAYIGAQPNKSLTKTTSQSFNGTGSATAFTLNRAVNSSEELEVFVDNVQQEPGSGKSYTATGTTLTFDEAPPLGTGNVYVIYRGLAEVTTRLEHDANQALSATTGTFTSLNVPTIKDSSGTNTAMTIDSSGRVIQNQRLYVFADISQTSGTNVYISHSAGDPIKFGNVLSGTASLLNTSTYKFQAPVDGLYMLQVALHCNSGAFQTSWHQNDTKLALNYNTDSETQHTSFTFNCDAGDECHIEADGSDTYYNGTGTSQQYTWATWAKLV